MSYSRAIFVSPGLGSHGGGIQVAGRVTLKALAEQAKGRNLSLHHLVYADRGPDGIVPDTVQTHPAPSKPWAVLQALRVRSRRALIVVWHRSLLKLLPFLAGSGSTVVCVIHGIEAWHHFGLVNRTLLSRVDRFLHISDFTWAEFVDRNPRFEASDHRRVPLGLGDPVDRPVPPPRDPPAALMLGRLGREPRHGKGHEEVIRAWPEVLETIPEARLWIAGSGERAEELRGLVRELGIQQRVCFWGWVSESRKQALIEQARCLALPSRGEGFGLVYLEAMRLGRPCLVSTLDAGREVVNPPEAGLEVDPDDRGALVDALRRLLSLGQDWDAMARRARHRYRDHYTETAYRRRFLEALPGELSRGAPRSTPGIKIPEGGP